MSCLLLYVMETLTLALFEDGLIFDRTAELVKDPKELDKLMDKEGVFTSASTFSGESLQRSIQEYMCDPIPPTAECLIEGSAGSGKTSLLQFVEDKIVASLLESNRKSLSTGIIDCGLLTERYGARLTYLIWRIIIELHTSLKTRHDTAVGDIETELRKQDTELLALITKHGSNSMEPHDYEKIRTIFSVDALLCYVKTGSSAHFSVIILLDEFGVLRDDVQLRDLENPVYILFRVFRDASNRAGCKVLLFSTFLPGYFRSMFAPDDLEAGAYSRCWSSRVVLGDLKEPEAKRLVAAIIDNYLTKVLKQKHVDSIDVASLKDEVFHVALESGKSSAREIARTAAVELDKRFTAHIQEKRDSRWRYEKATKKDFEAEVRFIYNKLTGESAASLGYIGPYICPKFDKKFDHYAAVHRGQTTICFYGESTTSELSEPHYKSCFESLVRAMNLNDSLRLIIFAPKFTTEGKEAAERDRAIFRQVLEDPSFGKFSDKERADILSWAFDEIPSGKTKSRKVPSGKNLEALVTKINDKYPQHDDMTADEAEALFSSDDRLDLRVRPGFLCRSGSDSP